MGYPTFILRDTSPLFKKLVLKAAKHAFRAFHILGPWKGELAEDGDGFWTVCVTPCPGYTGDFALLFFAREAEPGQGYLDTGITFSYYGFHPYHVSRGRTKPFGSPKKTFQIEMNGRR